MLALHRCLLVLLVFWVSGVAQGSESDYQALHLALGKAINKWQESYAADLQRWDAGSVDACRQPLQGGYFQRQHPRGESACEGAVPFLVMESRQGMRARWIDPARVRQIHVVFAGKGSGMVSRFGHIALRLVVCPDANSSDEQCALNVREHVLLGFMANVDTFRVSAYQGLTGHYKAHFYAVPFMDAYQGYAIEEFREIHSVPLRLESARRELLVRELAQIHWEYGGNYTFLDKNCAGLLLLAMRALFPEQAESPALATHWVRPDRFFHALLKSSLLDAGAIDDLQQAERSGFYFSSASPYYDKALRQLGEKFPDMSQVSLKRFLGVAPKDINDYYRQPEVEAVLVKDSHLAEAALILEELRLLRLAKSFAAALASMLDGLDLEKASEKIREDKNEHRYQVFQRCILGPAKVLRNPGLNRTGIPVAEEIQQHAEASIPDLCMGQDDSAEVGAILKEQGGGSKGWKKLSETAGRWRETMETVLLLKEWVEGAAKAPEEKNAA